MLTKRPSWTEELKAAAAKIVASCVRENGQIDYNKAKTEFAPEWEAIVAGRGEKAVMSYFSYARRQAGTGAYQAKGIKVTRRKRIAEPILNGPLLSETPKRKAKHQDGEILACPRCLTGIQVLVQMFGSMPNRCPKCNANLLAVVEAVDME